MEIEKGCFYSVEGQLWESREKTVDLHGRSNPDKWYFLKTKIFVAQVVSEPVVTENNLF